MGSASHSRNVTRLPRLRQMPMIVPRLWEAKILLNRGCDPQCLVDSHEVVKRHEQVNGGSQMRQLLAEPVGQPGEAPQVHPDGQIAFEVTP